MMRKDLVDALVAAANAPVVGLAHAALVIARIEYPQLDSERYIRTLDAMGRELDHAWFVGFAPAENAKIVVAVMIEFGGHGTRAAAIASSIIANYLKVTPISSDLTTGG